MGRIDGSGRQIRQSCPSAVLPPETGSRRHQAASERKATAGHTEPRHCRRSTAVRRSCGWRSARSSIRCPTSRPAAPWSHLKQAPSDSAPGSGCNSRCRTNRPTTTRCCRPCPASHPGWPHPGSCPPAPSGNSHRPQPRLCDRIRSSHRSSWPCRHRTDPPRGTPVRLCTRAAFSHSASAGSRAPAQPQ